MIHVLLETYLGLLLSMYSKIKGKYFSRSMYEKNSSLIITTWKTQAILMDGRHRLKGSNQSKVSDALILSDDINQSSGSFVFTISSQL